MHLTKQQQAIYHCLMTRPQKALTPYQIADALAADGISVSLATIYRHLDRLESDGHIHKFYTSQGTAVFQYCPQGGKDCQILRCQLCGRTFHLQCQEYRDFFEYLKTFHEFYPDEHRTAIIGWCASCQEKKTYGQKRSDCMR